MKRNSDAVIVHGGDAATPSKKRCKPGNLFDLLLPDELLLTIFRHLEPCSAFAAWMTCRRWNNVLTPKRWEVPLWLPNEFMGSASRGGHLGLMKWIMSVAGYDPDAGILPPLLSWAWRGAVDGGKIHILDWLLECFNRQNPTKSIIDAVESYNNSAQTAARNGDMMMLQWFRNRGVPIHENLPLARATGLGGDLDIVKLLVNNNRNSITVLVAVCIGAAESGNLTLLKLIWQEHEGVLYAHHTGTTEIIFAGGMRGTAAGTPPRDIWAAASAGGNVEMLKWLKRKNKLTIRGSTLLAAIYNGRVDAAQWIWDQRIDRETDLIPFLLAEALGSNSAAMLEWVCRRTSRSKSKTEPQEWMMDARHKKSFLMPREINGSRAGVVAWLHQNKCLPQQADREWLTDILVTEGDLKALRIHVSASGGWESCKITQACHLARTNEHMHVVHWLQDNTCTDGCLEVHPFPLLPDEILVHILGFLDCPSLAASEFVSLRWKACGQQSWTPVMRRAVAPYRFIKQCKSEGYDALVWWANRSQGMPTSISCYFCNKSVPMSTSIRRPLVSLFHRKRECYWCPECTERCDALYGFR